MKLVLFRQLAGIVLMAGTFFLASCDKQTSSEQKASETKSKEIQFNQAATPQVINNDQISQANNVEQNATCEITGVLRILMPDSGIGAGGQYRTGGLTKYIETAGCRYYFINDLTTKYINIKADSNNVGWDAGNKYRVKGILLKDKPNNVNAIADGMPSKYINATEIENLGTPPPLAVIDVTKDIVNLLQQNTMAHIQVLKAQIASSESSAVLTIEATDDSLNPGDGTISFKKFISDNLRNITGNFTSVKIASLSAPLSSPDGKQYVMFTLECR